MTDMQESLAAAGVEPSGPLRYFMDPLPPVAYGADVFHKQCCPPKCVTRQGFSFLGCPQVEIDDELEEQLYECYTTTNLRNVEWSAFSKSESEYKRE
jgi:hypothetical protein